MPAVQTLPPVQATPHPPQLAESLFVSTHALAQDVRPAPQEDVHSPAEHTWPDAHFVVHAPQWDASFAMSKHEPPQFVVPPGQAHEPAVQTMPPVHAMPHPPQLDESLVVSTHAPAQEMRPALHDDVHSPDEQT